jgi:putative membrane protein
VNNTHKERRQNPSRVRDHLANERTYLAWMRTAVAMMGFGVVILRISYLLPLKIPRTGQGWKLGLLFALVGLLTVLFTTVHYFTIRRAIDQDTYEPASWLVILFSLCVALIGSGVLYFLLTTPLSQIRSIVPK